MRNKILPFVIALILPFIIIEVCLHLLIKPSESSYGILFNRNLPPYKIIPQDLLKYGKSEINFGKIRENGLLGYRIKANYAAPDGKEQINNFGARSGMPTTPGKQPGHERILVFGDSATFGDKITQEDTFVFQMNEMKEITEFINFGVGSYSLGQSYLQFKALNDKLEFDGVFLVFAPTDGL